MSPATWLTSLIALKKKKKSTIVNIIFRYYPFVSSITEPTCYA